MSCKFKEFENTDGIHPWCYITGGECQFIEKAYDLSCDIAEAFKESEVKE